LVTGASSQCLFDIVFLELVEMSRKMETVVRKTCGAVAVL
jgi:hypothetical protein